MHVLGAQVADSYPLKFGGGFAGKFGGFGFCKSIIVTSSAICPGVAVAGRGAFTLKRRDRVVRSGLNGSTFQIMSPGDVGTVAAGDQKPPVRK